MRKMYVNNHKRRYKVGGLHLFRSERANIPDSLLYSNNSSYAGQEKLDRLKDRGSYSESHDTCDNKTTLINQLHNSTNDTTSKDMVDETLDAIEMSDHLLKFQFSETSKLEQSNEICTNEKNSYSVSAEKQINARAINNCYNSELKGHDNDKAYENYSNRLSNSVHSYSGQSNYVDSFNCLSKNVNCYSGLSNTVGAKHPALEINPVLKKPIAAIIANQKIKHSGAQQHNNTIQDDQNVHKPIDIKGKRSHDQVQAQMSQAKVQRKMSVKIDAKNNNPQCHSLSNEKKCRICNIAVHAIISHYVNVHPEREVFPSRLAPHVGTLLHSSQFVHTSKREPFRERNGYRQQCYFCDKSICLSKHDWIVHLTRHTGNYQYKCGDCSRKFAKSLSHMCKDKKNMEKIPQQIFDEANLFAYLCDICNFVRFERTEMEKHLRCEHIDDVKKGFKQVLFLSFQDVQNNVTGSTNETEDSVHEVQKDISGDHIANILQKNNDDKHDNQDSESEPKKAKIKPMKPISTSKKNNSSTRGSNQSEKCKICNNSVRESLVNHYVNVHPNNDVYPSRVAPKVGDNLRKSKEIHKCERVFLGNRWKYTQYCYFCNKSMSFNKRSWIDHIVRHTGYYQFRCTTSSMKFARKTSHNCGTECNIEKIPQPQLEKVNILAYVCECNYVRLRETELEDHINFNQQCNNITEFTLLSFPEHNGDVLQSNESNEKELEEMALAIEKALQESPTNSPNERFVDECDSRWKPRSSSSGVSVNIKNTVDKLKTPSSIGGDISGQLDPDNKIVPHATSEESFQGAQVEDDFESKSKPNNNFLCDLYKCKAIECDTFSTGNAENMLIHLQYHEENVASTLYSTSNPPSWLKCVYCDAAANTCQSLVTHITNEHQSNVFQCPHCIYRSCAACNTIFHLKEFHQSETKSVMICNGKEKNYANEEALIKKWCRENVRPFRCTKGCDKTFYAMDAFIKHMKTTPNHSNTFQCQLCGFTTSITAADKHFLCHNIAILQCIYCSNGYDNIERMKSHLCTAHPSKLPYICVRVTRNTEVLSNEEQNSVESTLILHVDETPKSFFSFANEMEKPDAIM